MLFILRRHEYPEAIRNGIAPVSLYSPLFQRGFFELFRFPPIRYRPAETTGSNVNPREAAMQQETFHWPHKDLLDVDQLTQEELFHLLDTAANLHEINSRPVKKVPILKGKSVVLFFAEPSTRTKTSF